MIAASTLDVSVIIPTYNRWESLLRLLESLDRQTLEPERFEIVVVDNNSSDGTHERVLAREGTGRARLRCLREIAQGVSHARNRGIRETTAQIVAFTDDDAEADPGWLEKLLEGMEEHSAEAVGGRTLPRWGAPLPDWWLPEYDKAFVRNWGDEACPVRTFPFFYSINLAVRRSVFSEVGPFDPRLGPRAGSHLVGEDADLCRRIHNQGGSLFYLPKAVVWHHVESSRLSRHFLRRRYYYSGATHALQRVLRDEAPEIPYQLKSLAVGFSQWIGSRSEAERFRHELEIWYRAGALVKGLSIRFGLPRP